METRKGILEACGNCNVSIIQVVSRKDWDQRPFPEVVFRVRKDEPADYALAAKKAKEFDLVIVEHEFGIFGGSHGSFVLKFLRLCQVPSVVVLHTVKYYNIPRQVAIVQELFRLTRWHVTLQERGCEQAALRSYNRHAEAKCLWIPHGVPPPLTCNREAAKAVLAIRFGWDPDDFIVYTGGLLHPNKGIGEVMLAARVNGCRGHVRVIITGVCHNAEYRNELINLSDSLGLNSSVKFIDRFLSQTELLVTIRSCDVTALLYKDMSQASSGVLAMSLGQGTPVIATPFSQAQSFKGGGVILVNETSISNDLVKLCSQRALLNALRNQAEVITRNRTWRNVGVILLGMTDLDSQLIERFSPDVFSPVAALSADRFEPPLVVKGDFLNIWMSALSIFLVDPVGMWEVPLAGDFLMFNNGKAHRLWEENHAGFITRTVFQEGCCWQERIWDVHLIIATVEKCLLREGQFFRWSLRVIGSPHPAVSGLVAGVDDLSLLAREGTPLQVRISHAIGRNTTLVEIAIKDILLSVNYALSHEVSINFFEGLPHYVVARCALPRFEALIQVVRQRVSLPPAWNLMRFLCISASSRNWCFSGEFVRFHSDAYLGEETMRIWDADVGLHHDHEMHCVEKTLHYRLKPALLVRKCVMVEDRRIYVNVSAATIISGILVKELILGMDNLDEAQIKGNPCYAGVCNLDLLGHTVNVRFPPECEVRTHVNGARHLHYLEARCPGNSVQHHVSWL